MISIIIPIYNVEKYLRQCLDSVVNQTYQDWEAILVDDGSSDSSPAICDEYAKKDSRFKVLHQANGGVSSARNIGLNKSHGEWLIFLDADDMLKNNAL
ncbi:MAG: glycosyltransferase family 2 protein, partial [Prevotella sp.]